MQSTKIQKTVKIKNDHLLVGILNVDKPTQLARHFLSENGKSLKETVDRSVPKVINGKFLRLAQLCVCVYSTYHKRFFDATRGHEWCGRSVGRPPCKCPINRWWVTDKTLKDWIPCQGERLSIFSWSFSSHRFLHRPSPFHKSSFGRGLDF